MARNPEATRARIIEAAAAEFAEHGIAGARYDRIATRARANKERIYAYFGDKEQLFSLVLQTRMTELAEAHALDPAHDVDPTRLAEHVGELFDFHLARPELTRLLLWEALHFQGAVPDEEARAHHYRGRRQAVARVVGAGVGDDALEGGPPAPAGADHAHLSFLLTSLVAGWFAVPQLARLHLGQDPGADEVAARQRRVVVEAARTLTAGASGDRPATAARTPRR